MILRTINGQIKEVSGGGSSGDNSIIAYPESSPAVSAHSTGTYVYYNDLAYEVIDDISIGDSLVVDTNIQVPTLPEGTVIYIPDGGGSN